MLFAFGVGSTSGLHRIHRSCQCSTNAAAEEPRGCCDPQNLPWHRPQPLSLSRGFQQQSGGFFPGKSGQLSEPPEPGSSPQSRPLPAPSHPKPQLQQESSQPHPLQHPWDHRIWGTQPPTPHPIPIPGAPAPSLSCGAARGELQPPGEVTLGTGAGCAALAHLARPRVPGQVPCDCSCRGCGAFWGRASILGWMFSPGLY